MDIAYISALSALAGSVVGGLASGLTTWMSNRAQARAGRLVHNLSRCQDLFKDFIIATSKVYGDACVSSEPQIQELVLIYGMISRMRVLCSPQIVAIANKIVAAAVDTFYEPNKTVRELNELIKGGRIDPLKEFAEAAREELQSLGS